MSAVSRVETQQKFIIRDDKFCAVGSFDWPSYRGEGPRRESSHYSEKVEDIALWKGGPICSSGTINKHPAICRSMFL